MRHRKIATIVGTILSTITAGLIIIVAKDTVITGLDHILMIIAGMTTVSALSAFQEAQE